MRIKQSRFPRLRVAGPAPSRLPTAVVTSAFTGAVAVAALLVAGIAGARAGSPAAPPAPDAPGAPSGSGTPAGGAPAAPGSSGAASPEAQFKQALLAAHQRDWAAAQPLLEDVERQVPGDAQVHSWLGYVYLEEGKPPEAIAELSQALRIQPSLLDAHNNLGNAYLAAGNPAGAAGEYLQAVHLNPRSFQAHYNLGNAYARLERWSDGAAEYRQALTIEPDSASAHNNLGVMYMHAGDPARALPQYAAAVQTAPNDPAYLTNYGLALKDMHQDAKAISVLQHALKLGAESDDIHEALGDLYARNGSPRSALAEYEIAAAHDTGNPAIYRAEAAVYLKLNDLASAVAAEKKATTLAPQSANAWTDLGWALVQQHSYPEAVEALDHALTIDPHSTVALGNLAVAYWASDQKETAARTWRRLLQIHPDDVETRRSLAAYDLSRSDYAGAQEQLQQALRSQPHSARLWYGLGTVLEEWGRWDQAIDAFRRATSEDPHLAEAYNNLGFTYEKRGMMAAAVKAYRRAVALDPHLDAARKNLDRFTTETRPAPVRR